MNASSRQGQAKRARVAEAGVAYIPRRIRSINGGSAADRGGAYVPRRMSVPHQQVRRVASRPRRGPRLVDALLLLVLALVEIPVVALLMPASVGGRTGWTVVLGHSMEPTLDPGDLVITRSCRSYDIGEVIVYRIPKGTPGEGVMVIHRITGGSNAEGFVTTGDNRDCNDPWRPLPSDIAGSHFRTIPNVGHVIAWMRSPLVIGLAMARTVYSLTLELLASAVPAWVPRHERHRRSVLVPG